MASPRDQVRQHFLNSFQWKFLCIVVLLVLSDSPLLAQVLLWGTTGNGGTHDKGTIGYYDPANGTWTTKFSFVGTVYTGSNPSGELTEMDGKFYGMTTLGGNFGGGVIFEWDPVTNIYTHILNFANGEEPYGSLLKVDGKFYGMTSGAAGPSLGRVFEWDPSTTVITKFARFDNTNGAEPGGSLTYWNGKFYGMTRSGGTNEAGVIFEWDAATNVINKMVDFGGLNGANPAGTMTVHEDKFYGMTYGGGTHGVGVIFRWDPQDNTYTKMVDLTPLGGANPTASLVYFGDRFYGMTNNGGSHDRGVLFGWDPTANAYEKMLDFDGSNGGSPYGSLTAHGENLYGMAGSALFSFDPSTNAYQQQMSLSADDGSTPFGSLVFYAGKFYGLTSRGGASDNGVIFEWDPSTGVYTKKVDFQYPTGSSPGPLTYLGGKLYGMTGLGGTNDWGTIFEFDPATNEYRTRVSINGHNGLYPSSSLTYHEGKFYGTTLAVGIGGILEWDPATNTAVNKAMFDQSNGWQPRGSLTYHAGKFYGLTVLGGSNNVGVIFEWDPSSNILIKKIDFESTLGAIPLGALTLNGGKLYGVTRAGGTNNAGVIFEWDPATNAYHKKIDFGSSSGRRAGGALSYLDGKFYGTAIRESTLAVIFQWDPATNNYVEMVEFPYANAGIPLEAMTYSGGKFYGSAGNTIFEWDPLTNVYLKKVTLESPHAAAPSQFTVVGEPVQHSITISTPLHDLDFYRGTSFDISYSVEGSFSNGNIFTAELSDASGGFGASTHIGSLAGTSSGTITATIPSDIPPGNGYRIRIVSSDPSVISPDNGTDLTVNTQPSATLTGSVTICAGTSADLSIAFTGRPPWTLVYTENQTVKTIITSEASFVLTVSPSMTTTYKLVSVTDGNGFSADMDGEAIVTIDTPPSLTVPAPILQENDPGKCGALVVFESSASGSPPPTIAYRINEAVITSPYFFPVGTTRVTAVATNDCVTVTSPFDVTVDNATPVITGFDISVDPQRLGVSVPIVVSFDDNNAASGTIDWGDGTISEGIMTASSFSGQHIYSTAGVYTIEAKVTDACGIEASTLYQYVVIYEPYGGFVTGGGWFQSPEGAYTENPQATGKATFGFVSKYHKGTSVPTGNTDFQFQAGGVTFKSTSYEWLVVAGYKAMFKGAGVFNGVGDHGFLVSAVDGNKIGSSSDKFRIKIWNSSGVVVYDNQLGTADNAEASTAIGGGSIVIHDPNGKNNSSAREWTQEVQESVEKVPTRAYPNPFVNSVTIEYQSDTEEDLVVHVMDPTGKTVFERKYHYNESGSYSVEFASPLHSHQIYFLKISQGRRMEWLKVMRR